MSVTRYVLLLAALFSAAPAQRPHIVKRGTIDLDLVEATPVVFQGRLYRFEYVRHNYWANRTGEDYFRFVDTSTGRHTPPFARGRVLGSALVDGGTVYVTGTGGRGKRWGAEQVWLYASRDLRNWSERVALDLPGFSIFNTSMCKAGDRYVLMFEIDQPKEQAGVPFTARFAVSRDLKQWKLTPPECNYSKDRYTAPHCLRYLDGYFYNFFLEAHSGYEMRVVRSKDLIRWEPSPLNPVLRASEDDRRIANASLTASQRQRIATAVNRNNSDLDFCEYQGRLAITYSWGNQQGVEHLAEAVYEGTEAQFLKAWFPDQRTGAAGAAASQGRKPLIAFGGVSHESDSFNPAVTTLTDFSPRASGPPSHAMAELAKGNTVASGFIEGAKRFDFDLYPVLLTGAAPKGPVTDGAFNALVNDLIRQVRAAPRLDGLLLANHGAMVVESHPHGDTELIRRVRQALGEDFPIVVVHDFHANETPEIARLTTALITYKENPHIDTKDRGIQAARIMADTVRGKVRPVQAIAKPPMLYNIVYQHTRSAPLLPIVEETRRLEEDPRILAASVAGGYQYADSEQMGPSAVVVTNNDRALAEREARRLSDLLWATRDRLRLDLPDAAAAVRTAIRSERHPVALIDMGDNIGGGSSGDGTFLLSELQRQKAEGWVVVLADPQAVQAAARAGIGGRFDMEVGGKTDSFHGRPARVRGRVKSLHDGRYLETEIRHGGGRYFDMGLTAVVEAEGSTRDLPNLLLLTTRRASPNSLHQLIGCGVYPQRQRILTVKGAIAPRAAYEPVAARIIGVDTPGLTSVNPARYTYRRVRRPLFGLE